MIWVLWPLAVTPALALCVLWACLLANLLHYRRFGGKATPLLPMTVLKPVKGLDDELRENFEALAAADADTAMHILIAIESQDDPAYPVLKAFQDAHPGRDIEIAITGPSRGRVGKMHNMISALPRARHPRVVFSDADIRATPELLAETSEAFRAGAEAVFAAPYHAPVGGLGGVFFQIAFNHGFTVPLALAWKAGVLPSAAGAWMGYTQEALDRAGGLESHAEHIADDYAVSRAVMRAGVRAVLLRTWARVNESGQGARDVFEHLSKWMTIIRWSLPGFYFPLPLLASGFSALALGLCGGGWGLFAVACLSRALIGLIQDLRVGGAAMPWYGYLVLAFSDFWFILFWLRGLRREISWRGRRYRLHPGGRVEALDWPGRGESAKVAAP